MDAAEHPNFTENYQPPMDDDPRKSVASELKASE